MTMRNSTTPAGHVRRAVAAAVLSLLGGGPILANAQTTANSPPDLGRPNAAPADSDPTAVRDGERLSDWLLRQPGQGSAEVYLPGLLWLVPQERPAQAELQRRLLAALPAGSALSERVGRLPVTGRAALGIPDPRWLQGDPARDPVLSSSHRLVLPRRPGTVTVLQVDGSACQVHHRPGALPIDYVRACLGSDADAVDWAWVAQPDGRQHRAGVRPWNLTGQQDEPAPGAWIWAPRRQSGIPDATSDLMIRFLATQGIANEAAIPAVVIDRLTPPARALPLSAGDFGGVGVLQTPSARMARPGAVQVHLSNTHPYTHLSTTFQPLEGLEAGFRYTSIANRLYGPAIAGSQSYKDKGFDIKLRLLQESEYLPELAVGFRDIAGTGYWSSEYLVGNKRFGDWDFSVGLAWGYMAGRQSWANPLSLVFGSRANLRPQADVGQGGEFEVGSLFRGRVAPFAGVQWHPSDQWILKAEIDPNNYAREPSGNVFATRSPINVGAVYRWSPGVALTFGIERGTQATAGLTLAFDGPRLATPKLFVPPVAAAGPSAMAASPSERGWGRTAEDIAAQTGWRVERFDAQGTALHVHLGEVQGMYRGDRLERLVKVLHRDAPAEYDRFVIGYAERGLALGMHEVDRQQLVARRSAPDLSRPTSGDDHLGVVPAASRREEDGELAPATLRDTPVQPVTGTRAAQASAASPPPSSTLWRDSPRPWLVEVAPNYSQILGGPDKFLLYQLGLRASAEWRFSPSTWLSGTTALRVLDNFEGFKYTAPSDLPRVRTFAREYVVSSRFHVQNLQLTHARQVSDSQFVSVYGGLLESMYAGIGAEWLYRPWRSPVAVGVDVNHVRQRGFKQDFSLRDYTVTTGHATLYWDTGWNQVHAKLQAGRYLAGDVGATLDVSRRFNNGFTIGAWATKTNVSAAQFGEGSFDKGVYMAIPFDALLPAWSRDTATITWTPLTRDGGARLLRSQPLFDLTDLRDRRAFRWGPPAARADAPVRTGERLFDPPEDTRGAGPLELLQDGVATGRDLAHRLTAGDSGHSKYLAAAAVIASAAFDKPADRWARNHQTPAFDRAGRAANAIPLVLGAGTALVATGLMGSDSQWTAWTSLKAAGYTLAGNTALRAVMGRARPGDGSDPTDFSGPSRGSLKSGFPSNHVGMAFALVTPFAQQHDMPWLYGVAAASAFGRVQSRQHWVSDTVAAGVIGYAIGSMSNDSSRPGRGLQRVSVAPNGVSATWSF